MKMTNKAMLDIIDVLNHFGDATGKIGYAVMKNRKRIAKELEDYEEQRVALVKKYGETVTDENGRETTRVAEGSENYKKFVSELAEILNLDVDVDIYTLPKSDLEEIPCVNSARAVDYEILENLLSEKE